MKDPRNIIKHPIVTEKSTDLKSQSWYVFAVDKKANKSNDLIKCAMLAFIW